AVLAAPTQEPVAAPAPVARPSVPTVILSSPATRRMPSHRPGGKPSFSRALLAIDPKDERHRPDIPPEFASAHAGEVYSWRVKICVSAAGNVTGATVLDRVHPLLDRRIGRAIETWRYVPAQQGGRAVHTCTALS